MKTTTLIFDLGNVVLTNDWHYVCPEKDEEFSNYFGISNDDMERGWNSFWPKFRTGEISEDEFWTGFLKTAGAKKIDVGRAKEIWRKYQKPVENMLNLLEKLKQNYRLAALTTVGREALDFKREKWKLDNYFEVIVSSGYSGLIKPDIRIYELVVKKLDVDPNQCLFIDDKEINLPPANKIGMRTILFTGQNDLERKLHMMNIKY